MENQIENKFNDDLDNSSSHEQDERPDGKSTNDLASKWNEIQEEYIASHPDIDTEDLYFEGGGFNGMIEKIADMTGKSIDSVKKEIENW